MAVFLCAETLPAAWHGASPYNRVSVYKTF
nr:MAG TPA: hypothetical protein [Caudoviricetes sp.]